MMREMNDNTQENPKNVQENDSRDDDVPEQKSLDTKPVNPNKTTLDPRGRIIKMSTHDKAKVDAVLNKMFGGRKNS